MSRLETNSIHIGKEYNQTGAVVTPIFQTSTYLVTI